MSARPGGRAVGPLVWPMLAAVSAVVAVAGLAWPFLVAAWWWPAQRRPAICTFAGAGMLAAVAFVLWPIWWTQRVHAVQLAAHGHPTAGWVLVLFGPMQWAVSVPLGAMVAGWAAWSTRRHTRGMAHHPAQQRADRQMAARTERQVARRVAKPRTGRCSAPPLAVYRSGDARWVQCRHYLVLPERALHGKEVLLYARPGGGKTTLYERRAQIAGAAGDQLIVFDCKGQDRKLPGRVGKAWGNGAGRPPRVLIWPAQPLAGWYGTGLEVAARLHASQSWPNAFFEVMAQSALQLACTSPAGVPRSSADFLEMLEPKTLRGAWRGDRAAERDIADLEAKKDVLPTIRGRYAGHFRTLGGLFDGTDDLGGYDVIVFQINPLALHKTAELAATWMLLDLGHYITERKDPRDRVVLLFDEASAVPRALEQAVGLAERGRGAGLSCWFATQSFEALEEWGPRLAASAALHLVLGTNHVPPIVAGLAGTRLVPEQSFSVDPWGRTDHAGTLRMVERPVFDPNQVLGAGVGDFVAIAPGWTVSGHVLEADPADGLLVARACTAEQLEASEREPIVVNYDQAPATTMPAAVGDEQASLPRRHLRALPASDDHQAVEQETPAPKVGARVRIQALAAAMRANDRERVAELLKADARLAAYRKALQRSLWLLRSPLLALLVRTWRRALTAALAAAHRKDSHG